MGHAARTGKKKNTLRVLVGKPEVKTPPGRRKLRYEDNIKLNPKYMYPKVEVRGMGESGSGLVQVSFGCE